MKIETQLTAREKLKESAMLFASEWNFITSDSRFYTLDFSFPALGVLDLLLRHSLPLCSSDEKKRELLRQSSTYFAYSLLTCWDEAAKVYGEDAIGKIILSLENSLTIEVYHPDGSYLLEIEDVITTLYTDTQNPLPVYLQFEIPLAKNSNILGLVAAGLLSAMSDFINGSPSKEQTTAYTQSALNYIAESSANFYRRLYPSDFIAEDTAVYFQGFACPPLGCAEDYPGQRAVDSFTELLKEKDWQEEELEKFFYNLSRAPIDSYAEFGFIGLAALSKNELSLKTKRVCEAISPRNEILQQAIRSLRLGLGTKNTPIPLVENAQHNEAKKQTLIDYQLGIYPLLSLPLLLVEKEELSLSHWKPLLENSILESLRELSIAPIDRLCAKLQTAKLLFLANKIDAAKLLLEELKEEKHSDSNIQNEIHFARLFLAADIELKNNQKNAALELCKQAINSKTQDTRERWRIISLFSKLQEEIKGAGSSLETLKKIETSEELPMYSRLLLLLSSEEDPQFKKEQLTPLQTVTPYSSEIFSMYFTSLIEETNSNDNEQSLSD